eukprot:TRINITY_DN2906_c0_g1_i6.p2 TRINITY_DN2906_c0_g1~~TRINITY_DN2906_c0_g1_i6.p2  ORF type:complete len:240 (+),score=25.52 TRINITY_DN2906_c0_g1_i6:297-1016(+)
MRSVRDERGMRSQRSGGGVHNSSSQSYHPPQQSSQHPLQPQQQHMLPPNSQGQPLPPPMQPSPGLPVHPSNNHHLPTQQPPPPQGEQQQQPQQQQQQQQLQYTTPQQQAYLRSLSPSPQMLPGRNDVRNDTQFDSSKVYQYLSEKWLSAKQRSADMSIPEKERPKIYVSQHNQWGQGNSSNMHLQAQAANVEQLVRKRLEEKKRQGSLSSHNSLELEGANKEKLPNGTPANTPQKGKWK